MPRPFRSERVSESFQNFPGHGDRSQHFCNQNGMVTKRASKVRTRGGPWCGGRPGPGSSQARGPGEWRGGAPSLLCEDMKTSSAKEPRNCPRAAGAALGHRSTRGGGTLPIQGSLSHAVNLPWLQTRVRAGLGAHGHRPPSPGQCSKSWPRATWRQRLRGQHPGLDGPSAVGGPWQGALTWALGLLIGVHDNWALVKEN